AGVEVVEADDGVALREEAIHEVRADEPGRAGDEAAHHGEGLLLSRFAGWRTLTWLARVVGSSRMRGMVFAAGLGTRLRPLTERLPKPVVPLLNRPLASYSLERLAALGVQEVAINTHHL